MLISTPWRHGIEMLLSGQLGLRHRTGSASAGRPRLGVPLRAGEPAAPVRIKSLSRGFGLGIIAGALILNP